MIVEPKFEIGQVVYPIQKSTAPKMVTCPNCCGKKTFVVGCNEKKINCPECGGRGIIFSGWKYFWRVLDATWVGMSTTDIIGVPHLHSNEAHHYVRVKDSFIKTDYMLRSTGTRSGTIWREEVLFSS